MCRSTSFSADICRGTRRRCDRRRWRSKTRQSSVRRTRVHPPTPTHPRRSFLSRQTLSRPPLFTLTLFPPPLTPTDLSRCHAAVSPAPPRTAPPPIFSLSLCAFLMCPPDASARGTYSECITFRRISRKKTHISSPMLAGKAVQRTPPRMHACMCVCVWLCPSLWAASSLHRFLFPFSPAI